MDNEVLRFYCDDTLKRDDNDKWNYLLEYAFSIAENVEFNILFSNHELTPEIDILAEDMVEKSKRRNKIYPSGHSLKYRLTNSVKDFIRSKQCDEWNNYNLEDISFLKDDKEFLATITHENQIILQTTEKQRNELKEKGFDFWCDWGDNPAEENANYTATSLIDRLKGFFIKEKNES